MINLFVQSRFWAWALLPHSTRKDPSLNLLMLLGVPATAWKPFWIAKGDSLLSGRSSKMTPRLETLANCYSCRRVHFHSPSLSPGHCSVIFFYLWVPCYVCERFITFCPHPPPSPTRGCTQAAFQQVRTRAQNAIYSGDKNKTKFTSIPWLTLSRCLLIEIRAKHDQPIDWVGPTQPPV